MKEETTSFNFIKKIEQYIDGEINEVNLYNFITHQYDQTKKWHLELSENQNSIVDKLYHQLKQFVVLDSNLTLIICYLKYLYLNNGIKHNTIVRNNKYDSYIKELQNLFSTIKIETNVNEIYINSFKQQIFYKNINLPILEINDIIAKKNFKLAYNKLIDISYNLHNDLRRDSLIIKAFNLLKTECFNEIQFTLEKEFYHLTLLNIKVLNDVLKIIDFITGYNNNNYHPYKSKLFVSDLNISLYSYCLIKVYNANFSFTKNEILENFKNNLKSYFEKRLSYSETTVSEKQIFYLSKNLYKLDKNYEIDSDFEENVKSMIEDDSFYCNNYEYLKFDKNNESHIKSIEIYIAKSVFSWYYGGIINNFKIKCLNFINLYYSEQLYSKVIQVFEILISDLNYYDIDTTYYLKYLKCIMYNYDNTVNITEESELYKFYLKHSEFEKFKFKSNKLVEYTTGSEIEFGKYKNRLVEDILNENPNYILWCIININNFMINGISFNLNRWNGSIFFRHALEINIAKLMIYELFEDEPYYESNDDFENDNYSCKDSYYDGGGGNEWSDPSEFW